MKDVLGVLKRHSGDKKAKLTLLIDEIDELNNYEPWINQRLRSLFMKAGRQARMRATYTLFWRARPA